jgi:2-oxoisovalerate dehydrogenase E1 component
MTWDRVSIVEQQLDTEIASAKAGGPRLPAGAALRPDGSLTVAAAIALFEDQVTSRQLDVAARELKKSGRSYYTIGSAGHEDNAIVGARLRVTDPALPTIDPGPS